MSLSLTGCSRMRKWFQPLLVFESPGKLWKIPVAKLQPSSAHLDLWVEWMQEHRQECFMKLWVIPVGSQGWSPGLREFDSKGLGGPRNLYLSKRFMSFLITGKESIMWVLQVSRPGSRCGSIIFKPLNLASYRTLVSLSKVGILKGCKEKGM